MGNTGNRTTGLCHDCVQVDAGEKPDVQVVKALGTSGRWLSDPLSLPPEAKEVSGKVQEQTAEAERCDEICAERCRVECAALERNPFARRLEQCECSDKTSSWLFDDDIALLERLEAANQGDRLLAKLHNNVVLFSTVACDIIQTLLQLTQNPQVWPRGRGDLLQRRLHEGLHRHAMPPARLLKALGWVYRAEELPPDAAEPARRCVLVFFSMTLAAGAAMKWRACPPATWQRRGVDPVDVLRGAESRLSEVIAGLRFLACIALVQHYAEPSLLGNRKLIRALTRATGVKVPRGSSLLAGMASEDERDKKAKPSAILQADASWDRFFEQSQFRPGEQLISLLRDLQRESEENLPGPLPAVVTSGSKDVPNSMLWGDEEVVFCPGMDEKAMNWRSPSVKPEGPGATAFEATEQWDDGSVLIPL